MEWELDEFIMFMQPVVAVRLGIMPSRLGVLHPQPSTHPLSHQPLHFSKHFCAVSVVEVTDPSPYLSIDLDEDSFGFLPIGASLCGFTDAFLELAAAFGTRFHMGIVSPAYFRRKAKIA